MNIPYYIKAAALGCLLLGAAACSDNDGFTTSAGARLMCSTDSLSFDTVLYSTQSITRQAVLYNRNSDGIRISRAWLEGGAASFFRVNIDGVALTETNGWTADDFEVRKNDSLFVFINVDMTELPNGISGRVDDKLCLQLESGVVQTLPLTVFGLDVAPLKSGLQVTQDMHLTADKPYLVYDSIYVAKGAVLTIDEGALLYMHEGAKLSVDGSLVVDGTREHPVVFRTDRTENMLSYLPYDRTAGRWGGITLQSGSGSHYISYADIHGGNYGIAYRATENDRIKGADATPSLVVENSVIHNVAGYGLELSGVSATVANSQISNTLNDCVRIEGGAYNFYFSTIAQFYPWNYNRGEALYLKNHIDNEMEMPIYAANFYHCYITGYADDVVMRSYYLGEMDGQTPFNFLFDGCVLRTEKTDEAQFVEVSYECDATDTEATPVREKAFRVFDTDNFIYDFHLLENAYARSKSGNTVATELYPLDKDGVVRSATPDAGCYEYVSQ
jgi:hypothetical protein